MSKIEWRRIFLVSLSGLVFAGLTIFALVQGREHWVALLILIGIATSMAKQVPLAPKRNAFVAGFLTALIAVWTQAAFLPLYFEYNPSYRVLEIPFGLSPQAYTVLFAPIGALLAGILAALVAWPIAKTVRPDQQSSL